MTYHIEENCTTHLIFIFVDVGLFVEKQQITFDIVVVLNSLDGAMKLKSPARNKTIHSRHSIDTPHTVWSALDRTVEWARPRRKSIANT